MLYAPLKRWFIGLLLLISILGFLRFKPWHYFWEVSIAREQLKVGFLPVT